jgi:hypothetical protein
MTVEYTKQWVRITDTLRPMIGLGISVVLAGLVFIPTALFTGGEPLPSLVAAGLVFCIAALVSLIFVRTRKVFSVNLGARQLRFRATTYNFSDIETVTSSPHHVSLQATDGNVMRVAVFWVSKDNLRVIDRMLRMLDNEKVRTGALTIIQDQFEAMSR